jgi:hypothetical protein
MGKMQEQFMKQQLTGSIGGDEDYLYEQYIAQEQMNEEYWQWKNEESHSIFPEGIEYDDEYYKSSYLPTPDEEAENYKQTKENGHS